MINIHGVLHWVVLVLFISGMLEYPFECGQFSVLLIIYELESVSVLLPGVGLLPGSDGH